MTPRHTIIAMFALVGTILACGAGQEAIEPTLDLSLEPTRVSPFKQRTAFGFFPSPPEAKLESILNHFELLGQHADFILVQPNIPWEEFLVSMEGDSQARTDLVNQTILARRNSLDWIFVIDPLNGLNRREFFGLPDDWEAGFANPDVRKAFTNFCLWVVREFEPRYLGLASEINTYMDAYPQDAEHYLSLYAEVYDLVKEESPETQVFASFQWDDLNNMIPSAAEGRPAYQTNWEQVEAFEPKLDLWVISSYPYFVFESGEIPADYYTPLLDKTQKPLAVAEGGWATAQVGSIQGSDSGQTAYLEAIHDQLGERLRFWVYLILADLDMKSIGAGMQALGHSAQEIETLSLFASLGLMDAQWNPRPALATWDAYRLDR